jgi:hypothetical protein
VTRVAVFLQDRLDVPRVVDRGAGRSRKFARSSADALRSAADAGAEQQAGKHRREVNVRKIEKG